MDLAPQAAPPRPPPNGSAPDEPAVAWQVGAAIFDPVAQILTVNGVPADIGYRTMALLAMLLHRKGKVVAKTEIMDMLWPGRAVSEASLTKCISRLRATLGDDDHTVLRTAHGLGYRIDSASVSPAGHLPRAATGALTQPAVAAPLITARVITAREITVRDTPARAADTRRRLFRYGLGAAALVCAAAGLTEIGRRAPLAHQPPAPARALYMKGMEDWAQRTPASLTQAAQELNEAVHIDPDYAEAYVGLADSYNLLREYSAMPGSQAYPLAKAAAQKAIALNPDLAMAHAAYAFALFWGDWDFTTAIAEYERALQLEPSNPAIHHWYATSLSAIRHIQPAITHIDRALELDPASRAIRADRGCILMDAGRLADSRAVLEKLAAEAPDFISTHRYLANLALITGDDAAYVAQSAALAALTHDAVGLALARATQTGLAAGGHAGFLHALLNARLAAFSAGAISAVEVASAYALLGDHAQAMRYMNLAIDRHDDEAIYLSAPALGGWPHDAEFQRIAARLHVPQPVE